ncbi:MAG TPA: hypothetical protein VGR26_09865 [Acidimicrobiales bacterium]|nr:hypothetical protein [Acidimicrobiales bacterium]
MLEALGKRWYGLASDTVRGLLTGTMPVVSELAEHFGLARRTRTFLTHRHLFTHRTDWFGEPTSDRQLARSGGSWRQGTTEGSQW